MERKQKEQLRTLLKARRRANKVLAERREAQQKKLERAKRIETNQERKQQFTQQLTLLAEQSGILYLAEQAALLRGGSLSKELSCYVDYGLSSSCLQQACMDAAQGELKPSHLALFIRWEASGAPQEVEVRVHKNGEITFHNSPVPILPVLYRFFPHLLHVMLDSALAHPRPAALALKMQA
jgi:hypothetical protein